jgi:hypothetical protein
MILPINYFGISEDKWMQHSEFRKRVMNEWRKIPRYLEMGFLKEI